MIFFNNRDWDKYKKEDDAIPEQPHYAVMMFRNTSFTEAGYDRDDSPTTRTVRTMHYYALPDKESWEKMIAAWYTARHQPKNGFGSDYDKENIVFFHSGGRGSVEVKIGVNVSAQHGGR